MLSGWTAVRESVWAYPALEVTHLFGVGMLLGNLVLFEARVLGIGKAIELKSLARLALPLAVGGFVVAGMSGLAMFASQPMELLPNSAFRWKMLLVAIAGANAAWFHARRSLTRRDFIARAQTVASLVIWIAVLTCGRLIAYV